MPEKLPPIPPGQKCDCPECENLATCIFRVDVPADYILYLGAQNVIRQKINRGIMFFDRIYYVGDLIYACDDHAYQHVWKPGQAWNVETTFHFDHASPAFKQGAFSMEELVREYEKLKKRD